MIEIADKSQFEAMYPSFDKTANYFRVDGVLFSATRKGGDSIEIHIAADKEAKKKLRRAVNRFCEYLFTFEWCKMIFAPIHKKSVQNLAHKCGWEKVREGKDGWTIYARVKP